jgi:hypothetical protein
MGLEINGISRPNQTKPNQKASETYRWEIPWDQKSTAFQDQTKPNQTKPNQTKRQVKHIVGRFHGTRNQRHFKTKPNQTKPNQEASEAGPNCLLVCAFKI